MKSIRRRANKSTWSGRWTQRYRYTHEIYILSSSRRPRRPPHCYQLWRYPETDEKGNDVNCDSPCFESPFTDTESLPGPPRRLHQWATKAGESISLGYGWVIEHNIMYYDTYSIIQHQVLTLNVFIDICGNLLRVQIKLWITGERTYTTQCSNLGVKFVESLVILSFVGIFNAVPRWGHGRHEQFAVTRESLVTSPGAFK